MSEMELNPFEILDAITPTVTRGKKEYIAGRICFAMHFYIPVDFKFTVPKRMVLAEARVRKDFGLECYEFWTAHEPYKPTAISKQTTPDPVDLLKDFSAQNDTHFTGAFNYKLWTGLRNGDMPATQMVTCFYDRSHEREGWEKHDDAETFQVNIPLTTIEQMNRPQFLQKLFAELCNILEPLSAVGGLCMATPLNWAVLQEHRGVLLPILDNHPGLLVGQAFDMSLGMRFNMSAVNWLTAIHGELTERCGGLGAVKKQLTRDGFETALYGDKGLLVQAGPSPQLGNIQEGVTLPHYGDLARALKPARLKFSGRGPHVLHYGTDDMMYYTEETLAKYQNAWLSRFDEMF